MAFLDILQSGKSVLDSFVQRAKAGITGAARRIRGTPFLPAEKFSALDALKFGRSILQQTARSGAALALSSFGRRGLAVGPAEKAPIISRKKQVFTIDPTASKIERLAQGLIFGKEPLRDVSGLGEEAIGAFGISEDTAKRFGFPAGIAIAAIDFTGFGGEKNVLKLLARANKTDEVINILKTLRMDTKAITALVPELVTAQTTDVVSDVLKGISKRERGFITSAKELLPKADKIAGQYVPRATDPLAIKARNLIRLNAETAERIALTRSDDVAVAVASELIKKYGTDAAKVADAAQAGALYDKAAEIANSIAPKLTESGRTVQAASILGRLTPEGQLRLAAREILKFNELNPTKKIPELTGKQTEYILNEMREIVDMVEGMEKAARFQRLQDFIKELVPSPMIDKVIAIWKAGLLTGIKTSGLNLFSNISHGITEVIKDIPAVIVDNVTSLFTGERAKALTLRGAGAGVQEGFSRGLDYFKTGFDERNIAAKLDYRKVNFGKGKVANTFKRYTEIVFRSLGAADQPFYYGALTRSLHDQALAQGINKGLRGSNLTRFAEELISEPSEAMIRYAVTDATTAVFQNQTTLGRIAKAVQKIPLFGEFILPFGRTPSSVAMQIVNYSPVGVAKTIIENIGKGRFDQRLFSQGLGRGLTGTAVLAIGMELAKKGLVALDYPRGDEREQKLQEAEGIKNNAIKIGGKWRSPIVLGPAGNLLLVGAHIQVALEQSGSPTEAFTTATFGTFNSFLEQTFVTGIRNFLNVLTDPKRYAKSYLPNLIGSFVPTLISDIARVTDPFERRAESTLQRIQMRIPGARRAIEPKVDILGRELERIGNPLEVLIDPTRPSPERGTFVTDELRRLTDAGFRVAPTALGDRSGFDALSREENTELWKFTGTIVSDKLDSLFSKKYYLAFEDDQKADTVKEIINKAKVNARAGYAIHLTMELTGDDLKEKLSELKTSGYLTRSVFTRYLELR